MSEKFIVIILGENYKINKKTKIAENISEKLLTKISFLKLTEKEKELYLKDKDNFLTNMYAVVNEEAMDKLEETKEKIVIADFRDIFLLNLPKNTDYELENKKMLCFMSLYIKSLLINGIENIKEFIEVEMKYKQNEYFTYDEALDFYKENAEYFSKLNSIILSEKEPLLEDAKTLYDLLNSDYLNNEE